jgi:hypothetical protein
MKKILTSLCLSFALFIIAFSSKAAVIPGGTYYVISGESFSLTPAVTSLFQYQWLLNPGVGQVETLLDNTDRGVYTKIFGTGAELGVVTNKLTFGVLAAVDGCLSDVIEHTIIVLPKITVTLTAPDGKDNFCLGIPVSTTLTANVTAVTGLGTYGVTLSPFTWTNGGTAVNGETTSTLSITSAGTYQALVSYILPSTGSYIATASKLLNAVNGLTKEIKNDLPLPVVPSISLN